MLLSVIVPVYNVENYIKRCLDSICRQTFYNLEIILVDDGSTDSSGKICDEYAALDQRVTVYHVMNNGVSSARNLGIQKSKGEYITFVDGDDWLDRDLYEKLICYMQASEADIASCKIEIVEDYGCVKSRKKGYHFLNLESAIQSIFIPGSELLFGANVYNKIFKRNLISNTNFNEDLICAEDFLFMWEILNKKPNIIYADDIRYYYYQRETSICHIRKNLKIYYDQFIVAETIYNDRKDVTGFVDKYITLKYIGASLELYYYNFKENLLLINLVKKNLKMCFIDNYFGKKNKLLIALLFVPVYIQKKIYSILEEK